MEVEGRLDKLEGHAVSTEHRLGNLSAEIKGLGAIVSSQGSKLDQIIVAVTTTEAAAKATPRFEFGKMLSIVKDLAYLGALVGVLSTWLIITLTTAENRVKETQLSFVMLRLDSIVKRMDRLDDRLGWTPNFEGKPK